MLYDTYECIFEIVLDSADTVACCSHCDEVTEVAIEGDESRIAQSELTFLDLGGINNGKGAGQCPRPAKTYKQKRLLIDQ